MHNPQAGSSPQTCYNLPSEHVKEYKKLLFNDGDFMNESKISCTVNNFETYYNWKQL